jgi:hypothetical protein
VSLEDAIKGALQGLETHVGAFAGFLQDTSNTLRTVAENTRETDFSAIGGILYGFKGIFSEVGKVGKAMVEAFDAEAFAHSTSVSQAVIKDPAIKKPATEGIEVENASNSSSVPVAAQHDNVLATCSMLAKADTSTTPAASSHASLAAYHPLGKIRALAPERRPKPTPIVLTHGRANGVASHAEAPLAEASDAPFTEYDALRRPYTTFADGHIDVDTSLSTHVRSTEPASCAEAPSTEAPNAPFAAYASLKDPWKISSEQRPSRYVGCNHCQITMVCTICSKLLESLQFADMSWPVPLQEKFFRRSLPDLCTRKTIMQLCCRTGSGSLCRSIGSVTPERPVRSDVRNS